MYVLYECIFRVHREIDRYMYVCVNVCIYNVRTHRSDICVYVCLLGYND